jgi:hypothetical protein
MIFGNPADFAIEAEDDGLPTDLKGILAGHMRIWCNNSSIGDFGEKQSCLWHSQQALAKIAADLSAITNPELWNLGDEDLWDRFDQALYIDVGQSKEEMENDCAAWGAHDFLTNWGEMFNGNKGMIYCLSDGRIRVLVQHRDASIRNYIVTEKGFKDAIAGFSQWCISLSERILSKK